MNSSLDVSDGFKKPIIYSRKDHAISRKQISSAALKVLYGLNDNGYRACLVGGGVRDLLLGRAPKDFDIATDAHPEKIRQIFKNSRLIGRRFRLAHVRFGREIIEVATFRSSREMSSSDSDVSQEGQILRDNAYGTLEEDVWRRDFTINALYYDIRDFSVLDYVGGVTDLRQGVINLIGKPVVRYREDPVRMLRAIRFSAKLGFTIARSTMSPIPSLVHLLNDISPARLFDETMKLFNAGHALATYERLSEVGLFALLYPSTRRVQTSELDSHNKFVLKALRNTDHRILNGKSVNPAFLISVFLWYPMKTVYSAEVRRGNNQKDALRLASEKILREQAKILSIPRRFTQSIRDIWELQARFSNRSPRRASRLLEVPKFRAAYDFLLLRSGADRASLKLADWWTRFQSADFSERKQLFQEVKHAEKRRKK
jgi:poly(A) polymerase